MSHHCLDYAARIRKRGFRLTPQRELILDAICEGKSHTTLDEIYARVQAKAPAISLATVYRALGFWSDAGIVIGAEIQGHKVYEIVKEMPHHHLVCRACGQVTELDHESVKMLFDIIKREQQFDVDTDHLVLHGLCQQCRPTEK
jgi:Fur family ferric uptake transcriptional regulator